MVKEGRARYGRDDISMGLCLFWAVYGSNPGASLIRKEELRSAATPCCGWGLFGDREFQASQSGGPLEEASVREKDCAVGAWILFYTLRKYIMSHKGRVGG